MNEQAKRIKQVMKVLGMNSTKFSDETGIMRAALSHITSGRNNPSADVLTKILERFTDIDPGWLITGRGTMLAVPAETSGDLYDQNRQDVSSKQADGMGTNEHEKKKKIATKMP